MQDYLIRRIEHAQERAKIYAKSKDLSMHGHYSKGYWEGMVAAYESALGKLSDIKIKQLQADIEKMEGYRNGCG